MDLGDGGRERTEAAQGPAALQVQALPPAIFAPVMSTGIVSVAAHQQGQDAIARALFALAAIALLALWLLSGWRLVRHPARVASDLHSHRRAPGFFTTVAATAVVGTGSALVFDAAQVAFALLALAGATWLVATYSIFTALAITRDKPSLEDGIDGSWLLAVVATQSVAVLAALLSPSLPQPARMHLNFLALCAWLVGGMLYTWLMTLVLYRLLFFRFEAQDLTGPWWITMGAMAISALAGAQLIMGASGAPMLEGLLPVVRGATLLFWATGTWWLPLLLVLAAWRVARRGAAPRYELSQWSAVFPLGMYSVATGKMAIVFGLPFLQPVSTVFLWVAMLAWLACAVGLLRSATS
jgi:tellurite resistance protein TehA-like permease